MNRVNFTLPSVGAMELREVEGIVWMEDGYLMIEVKTTLMGIMDEDVDLYKIEPWALKDVYIEKRLFKDRLVLIPKKRDLLDMIPGKHVSDVRLRVWRKKRSQVLRLIDEIEEVMDLGPDE